MLALENYSQESNPTFRISLSRVNEEVILGFENTNNGNRVTITYPNNANYTFWDELPDWLGDGDFHIVTNDSIKFDRCQLSTDPSLSSRQ